MKEKKSRPTKETEQLAKLRSFLYTVSVSIILFSLWFIQFNTYYFYIWLPLLVSLPFLSQSSDHIFFHFTTNFVIARCFRSRLPLRLVLVNFPLFLVYFCSTKLRDRTDLLLFLHNYVLICYIRVINLLSL